MTWAEIYPLIYPKAMDKHVDIVSYIYGVDFTYTKQMPFEKCFYIKPHTSTVYLGSMTGYNFYLSDPYRKTHYRIDNNALIGEQIKMRPRGNMELASGEFYHVQTIVHKKRKDKTDCFDYKRENDYARCVSEKLRRNLLNAVGCLPPWLPKPNKLKAKVCPSQIVKEDKQETNFIKKVIQNFTLDIKAMGKVM